MVGGLPVPAMHPNIVARYPKACDNIDPIIVRASPLEVAIEITTRPGVWEQLVFQSDQKHVPVVERTFKGWASGDNWIRAERSLPGSNKMFGIILFADGKTL
jgi:hypothetical protein